MFLKDYQGGGGKTCAILRTELVSYRKSPELDYFWTN